METCPACGKKFNRQTKEGESAFQEHLKLFDKEKKRLQKIRNR